MISQSVGIVCNDSIGRALASVSPQENAWNVSVQTIRLSVRMLIPETLEAFMAWALLFR